MAFPSSLGLIKETMGEEQKPMSIKSSTGIDLDDDNNDKSPSSRPWTSQFRPKLTKQTSQKGSCLCSPTTHAGSFRCRYHRNSGISGIRRNGLSIGSGLSELGEGPVKLALSSNPSGQTSSNGNNIGGSVNVTK